jgi:hypothetical protein
MAASQAYYDWIDAGRPYELIIPARDLKRNISRHGITVWDYPNNAHLTANPPEDHTPFSATGFPGKNARWKARALDVMPRSSAYDHRKENADIARRLIRDRDAGRPEVAWIKYINWTDENGVCRQERWTDLSSINRRTTRSSSDKGHIHISGRSDYDTSRAAYDYDPVALSQNGDSGMATNSPNWNDAQKARAVFDMVPTTTLDTDASADGSGSLASFPTPIVNYILELEKRLTAVEKALAAHLTDPALPAEPLTQAQFDRMYRDALSRTTLPEEQA